MQRLLKDAPVVPEKIERPEDVGLVVSFAIRRRPGTSQPGALVEEVRQGPARSAGVKVGDLITSINGTTIDSESALRRAFRGTGGSFRVAIQRDDSFHILELTSARKVIQK